LDHDVIIIGAGPAGTSVARALQDTDLSILLLDKSEFPRPKSCGGVLPPRIYSELEIPDELQERPLEGYRIFSGSGRKVESKFPKPGLMVNRLKFDEFLVKSLNMEVEKAQISDLKITSEYIEATGKNDSYRAKIVVGADGINSVVRKHCGFELESVATTAQYEFSVPREVIDEQIGNWFEVYYIIPNGYAWIVPLKESVKIGMGSISPDFKKNPKKALDEFLTDPLVKNKILNCSQLDFQVYRVPMGGPLETLAADRTLLIGDAGGFVYPGTGEGVYYGVKSGRVAGETIKELIETGKFDLGSINNIYIPKLTANGLLSLRDSEFLKNTLASPESIEKYIKKLSILAAR
jgi:geranylgeranyl reductase family protein